MRTRRQARETALQALYQCDSLDEWDDDSIALFFQAFTQVDLVDDASTGFENAEFCRVLVHGVRDVLQALDQSISQASTHWNLERMARVDRNILRLAAYEMSLVDEIPVNVSINEAIEIAKRFGTEDSSSFVNGVLDPISKDLNPT